MSDGNSTKLNRVCDFPGCGRKHSSQGLCGMHDRQRSKGEELRPIRYQRKKGSPPEIEYDEVDCPVPGLIGPCHVFRRKKNKCGYGVVVANGRSTLVHRYVWEQVHGAIADGMEIDHRCRVRDCCNTNHLREVTHQVNTTENVIGSRWKLNQAATHCIRGHEFTEENTYRDKDGHRGCRECRRTYLRLWARKNREKKRNGSQGGSSHVDLQSSARIGTRD